jgi:RHS repeat-associated protein
VIFYEFGLKNNHLLNANHWTQTGAVWANTDNYSENNISYDLNGNIKTLNRRGATTNTSTFGQIDLLSYTYDAANSDKLLQIADGSGQTKGFKKTNASANYGYDANGNMTQDNNKVLGITYNHLNLPTTFTVNSSLITMTYTADGEKLTKVAGANTKNYVSGIEYKGAALEAIYTSEGRCTPNGATAFFYEYTIKDHLGNARVSFRANGAAVSVIQENHYYAFGMEMEGAWATQAGLKNNYEYNGKELNEDFGLNLSDYGARWYDAAVGRWWSVDPLAEKTLSRSSYCYGLNNPIRMIDPNGMEATTNSPEFAVIINNDFNAKKSDRLAGNQFFGDGGNGNMLPEVVVTATRPPSQATLMAWLAWDDFVSRNTRLLNELNNFAYGFTEAWISNNAPTYERQDALSDAEEFGQDVGDLFSLGQAFYEMNAGVDVAIAGGALTLTGEGALIGVPAISAGTATVGHGMFVGGNALRNMSQKGKRAKENDNANDQLNGLEEAQKKAKKERPSVNDGDWEGSKKRPKQNQIESGKKSKDRAKHNNNRW